MTISCFRAEIKKRIRFAQLSGSELDGWYKEINESINSLWKNGFITDFSDEILALANGYQVNSGNYETFHVSQTFDLRSISAEKKAVKEFAAFILCGRG